MIKLVSNNKNIEVRNRLTCRDHYTSSDCWDLFDGGGYEVTENDDLSDLCSGWSLILHNGSIIYDWTLEETEDSQWVVVSSDGKEYDDDEIVYEVHPEKLAEHLRGVKLECLAGGKESVGLEVLRVNMRNYRRRAAKLDGDRQRRNSKVK